MQDPEQVAKRPLLAGDDPQAALDALMEKRRSQYGQVGDRLRLLCTFLRAAWYVCRRVYRTRPDVFRAVGHRVGVLTPCILWEKLSVDGVYEMFDPSRPLQT